MKFSCNLCNYSTDVKFCYEKHLSTQKHKEKVNDVPKLSQCYPKVISNDSPFECPFCNITFTKSCNLSRHKNTCIEKQNLIDTINNLQKELQTTTENLQQEMQKNKELLMSKDESLRSKDESLRSKDVTIQQVQSENRNLRVLLNNAGSVIKTSVSTFSYIVKNYNEAPALEHIKDIPKLHFDLTTNEFIDQING